jgi:uncharacterized RDD family membrane protein YckC
MKRSLTLSLLLLLAFGLEMPAQLAEEPAPKNNEPADQIVPEPPSSRRQRRRELSSDHVQFGGRVEIKAGEQRGDLVVFGGSVEIESKASCWDLVVIGGLATVHGTVNGDLVTIGTATLGSNAVVRGDTVVIGGPLYLDPSASTRERVVLGAGAGIPGQFWMRWPVEWFSKGLLWSRPLPHQYAWCWAVAGVFLLLYVLAALLFPRPVEACVEALRARPASSFFAGLLAFGLFLPVLLLLLASVVGIPLVPLLVFGMIAAFFFGKVAIYRYAGQQVGAQMGLSALQKPLLALLCGALLFYALYTIPILGFLAWGAAATLGVGAVVLALVEGLRSTAANGAAATASVPVAIPPGAPPPTGAAPAVEPSNVLMLPRVGFWLRLAATGIDAALISLIIFPLLDWGKGFILIWTAYHVAMWAWKGTTVGGLALGLKIVRADGRPIDFGVALVRVLSAFLSAAALFVGFFWAGWSADRQSWHDKIAGTVIVKWPRGVSAF